MNNFSSMKKNYYLITGASGLLGYEVASKLSGNEKNYIYILIRKESVNCIKLKNKFNNIEVIIGDLSDINLYDKLPLKLNYIIHLAQSNEYKNFEKGFSDVLNINLKASFDLLQYALKINCERFFYASSGSVYDSDNQLDSFHEYSQLKLKSIDLYSASKIATERILLAFDKKIEIVIGRFFFLYGLRQKEDMFIPRIINSVHSQKEIQIYKESGLIFNPTSVEFASECLINLLEKKAKGIFNIASKEKISLLDFVKITSEHLNIIPNLKFVSSDKSQNFLASIKLLEKTIKINHNDKLEEFIKLYIRSNYEY